MKSVYSSENRIFVMNNRNILQNAGIDVEIRNEHTPSGTPGNLVWPELWVSDNEFESACKLLSVGDDQAEEDWQCNQCQEANPGSMNICWNCQASVQVA
ncbi:MAG: DUF2007 domain-containing protein [Enterobacterales bacterium]|nr:DUF2007 domain-containing protein [Enterobacterales bacterium]